MYQVNIREAKSQLSRLIEEALNGHEVIIAKKNRPLVRLEVLPQATRQRRIGGARGILVDMSDDFDEPLADFSEYMP